MLIALLAEEHVHHHLAESWFTGTDQRIATCPITLGSLVRLSVREGQPMDVAHGMLADLARHERHEFWPDAVSYLDVSTAGVIGHRQVTDAYLAQLARARGGRLATFNQALAKLHPDIADLVPDHPE